MAPDALSLMLLSENGRKAEKQLNIRTIAQLKTAKIVGH